MYVIRYLELNIPLTTNAIIFNEFLIMNKFNFDYQQDFFTINSKLNDSHITFAHCINKDKIH